MHLLGVGVDALDLVQLSLIIEGHHGDVGLEGITNERSLLTGVSKDDTRGRHA